MPNSNYNDIFTSTIENRTRKLADNVTKHSALLDRLNKRGKIRTVDGGSKILEELEYGEGDTVWYSGYDAINYSPKQLFTAAEYALKLCAVPVAISGEEMLINSGREQMINLFQKRIENAEKTMKNTMAAAIYGDGTANSGKTIGGLKLLIADDPTSGTVGNINRATSGNEFWRNKTATAEAAFDKDTIRGAMDKMYIDCTRNTDKPDLIVTNSDMYMKFEEGLTQLQRFSNPKVAEAGFTTLQFKGADVVYDSNCPDKHMYFLNTDYIYLRPHKDRNMKVIGGDRMAINQDALYRIIGWAGNMTLSNASLQGVLIDVASGTASS